MTLIDRAKELLEKSKKATPGPWRWDDGYGFANVDTGVDPDMDDARVNTVFSIHGDDNSFHDNGPYLAACSPETIALLAQALIEAVEKLSDLEVTETRYRAAHDMHGDGHATAGYCWDKMRKAGDRAREFLRKHTGESIGKKLMEPFVEALETTPLKNSDNT